ncbi:YggT family protein [candidate division FCPU426 bacterium]|nr:YggT family protein [candidate division FCPU426 bacterium]
MAQFFITGGLILDWLATLWIALILLSLLVSWLPKAASAKGVFRTWLMHAAEPPILLLRRTLPTVYRGMDFAPWLAILILVLMKAFIFRAMIYWGMLNRPPL